MAVLVVMGQEDYQELSSFLKRFTLRVRVIRSVEGLCLLGIAVVLFFSLGVGVNEIKFLLPYAPLVYSGITAATLILLISWILFQAIRRISEERAAVFIEGKHPYLKNNLINSIQLFPQLADRERAQNLSVPMVLALLRATKNQLRGIRVEELVKTERLKAELRLLGMVFLPVLLLVIFNPSTVGVTFSLLLDPLKNLPPSETFIEVRPKDTRVVRGTPLTIEATASGAIPKSVQLMLRYPGASGEESHAMEVAGQGEFALTMKAVQRSFQYRVATGPFSSDWFQVDAIDLPQVVNVKVTLYPPHYTASPAQSFEGGHMEAIRGTSARVEALTSKEVVKANLVIGGEREIPLKVDGNRLQGSLVLLQSHRYHFLVEDTLGFSNASPVYQIRVLPDGFPTVEILQPTEDLEVHGDETLLLQFSARDDFGIQGASLIARIGDREEKLEIPLDPIRRLIPREEFRWDLDKLDLQPGEEVVYHIEVLDNDTISGPKKGTSRSLTLRLKDLRKEHRQVAEMIRDLSKEMLDLLADHLQSPPVPEKEVPEEAALPEGAVENRADQILKSIDELMQRTEQDRLADFATWADLESLKRNLEFAKEDLMSQKKEAATLEEKERLHDEIATELERMSLLSEEISNRLRTQELAATAQDVMKSQERLLDSLQKLQSGDKNLDEVLQEISKLAQLLGSLQQSLSQFASRLPEEFMNSQAMRDLNFRDMFSFLDEIRKKLMEGDIEGAMKLAQELFHQLASMVAALQNAQQMAMSSSLGRMQGEMMRSSSELEQIVREQQDILLETEGIEKAEKQERERLLGEKLKEFTERAKERLSQLSEHFPDRDTPAAFPYLDESTLNHLLKNLITRLEEKDLAGFAEILAMAEKEVGREIRPHQKEKRDLAAEALEGFQGDLKSLQGEPAAFLTEEEKMTLRELTHREGILQQRTEELSDKLKALFQLFPSLDPRITKNIEEAGKAMGKAEGRLGELNASGALPPEREALKRLSESQNQMQSSMQQLAQRGQLGRMPLAYLFRRGRFFPPGAFSPFGEMPNLPQFDVEGGWTGLDMEKFRLPGKDDYRVPRSFREEILESLKQGVPSEFKEQVERYFKNLSE